MKAPGKADPVIVAGYAVGVGLVFVATLGVYWQFWQPALNLWVWGGGSFAIGAAIGGVAAVLRRVKL